jgi:DNA repair protein RadC
MTIKLKENQKIKILNTEDIYQIMREILLRENRLDRKKEHCWVCSLNTQNELQLIELISLGTLNMTIVEPVDVFAFALQKQAAKFILVHNHPSGDLNPSPHDIDVTDRMQAVGHLVKVPMVDHLIITENEYFSFNESGMLAKIIKKSNYDLDFKKIDKLMATIQNLKVNSLKEQLEHEKQLNERTSEIARQMIANGVDLEKVAVCTGMSIDQVKELREN